MKRFLLPLIVLGVAAGAVGAEQQGHPHQQEVLDLARLTIERVRYPALITVDDNGQPRARTVDAFQPDEDFVVWVATRPNTRKVAQIRGNGSVTLYYFDEERKNYVTIMGTAQLVDDETTKRQMRRPADSDRLYPEFPDDYLLIKITPDWLEGILPGFRGDPKTWQPVSVTFN